jgi:hypothetical protein
LTPSIAVPSVSNPPTAAQASKVPFLVLVDILIGQRGDAVDPEFSHLYATAPWITSLKNAANNFRFWLYGRLITALKPAAPHSMYEDGSLRPGRIAVVDATDVAFQSNPFSDGGGCFLPQAERGNVDEGDDHGAAAEQLVMTLEDKSKHFGNEIYNPRWLSCFPKPFLRAATGYRQYISCAGVTLGTRNAVKQYVDAQIRLLSAPSVVACAAAAALDQGSHNALLLSAALYDAAAGGEAHRANVSASAVALGDIFARPPRLPLDGDSANAFAALGDWRTLGSGSRVRLVAAPSHALSIPPVQPTGHEAPEPMACTFHGTYGRLRLNGGGDAVVRRPKRRSRGASTEDAALEGRRYAIVHQYTSDRHPPLMEAITKRYDL